MCKTIIFVCRQGTHEPAIGNCPGHPLSLVSQLGWGRQKSLLNLSPAAPPRTHITKWPKQGVSRDWVEGNYYGPPSLWFLHLVLCFGNTHLSSFSPCLFHLVIFMKIKRIYLEVGGGHSGWVDANCLRPPPWFPTKLNTNVKKWIWHGPEARGGKLSCAPLLIFQLFICV